MNFFLLGKANIITRVPTVDASKSPPDFIFKMYFTFFNVKILRGFTFTFVAICSSASYPFEFPYRNNMSSLDKLKFLVNTLINKDKKVSFIRVDKDGALDIPPGFMRTRNEK